MASSGRTAWAKYFQGRGDVATTLKKESFLYDPDSPKTKLGFTTLPAGTKVTYLKTTMYETPALISYMSGRTLVQVRVPFDNIAKPGVRASGAASLKPQAFNVGEKQYPINDYIRVVTEAIEERNDLSGSLKTYLTALFDHYATGNTSAVQLTKIYNTVKTDIPINDINKDFGETVGPVACYKKQLLVGKGITLSRNTLVYMPSRPNEPLMDYALIDGKQYTISAKSGKTTNVVKPPDIIDLISKNPAKLKKWADSPEFKVLKILADESILLGPIKAVSAAYPELITEKAADSVTKTSYDKNLFTKFVAQNQYLRGVASPTSNEIMYECEKMIQKKTKDGDLNMNSIFSDAIEESVLYVKFEVGMDGTGKWDVIASDDIRGPSYGNVYLRTKNGYTRAADRMGVQV